MTTGTSPSAADARRSAERGSIVAGLALIVTMVVGCPPTPRFDLLVDVVDEGGRPVAGADVALDDETVVETDATGRAALRQLEGPVLALVSSPGFLTEPLPIGWSDQDTVVRVTLLGDGDGTRWVLHAGGDTMLGRRYEEPRSGEPLLPAGDLAGGARAVVEGVRRAFTAADLKLLNLESTVTDLEPDDAYIGKRFILNTRPEALAAWEALEVDAVILANNHVNDYETAGVRQTQLALDSAGIPRVGAADNASDANEALVLDVGGIEVGIAAWTSVTGSFVNNSYPLGSEPIPEELDPDEAWLYEARTWSFAGATWSVPAAPRRIGDAWQLFKETESDLSTSEGAAAWASLRSVYPELQDWVARRGHGGAAMWLDDEAPPAIEALGNRADLVIVQLHSGFQYSSDPSIALRDNAYRAIDAGADLVVCHHPHVLQGMEWYRGKLIAWSLGNFLFDQDFLVTFPSVFLRTVWEGTELIEARVLPIELAGYRPSPAVDDAADRTLRLLGEMSARDRETRRDPDDLGVRAFLEPLPTASDRAVLTLENHTAVLGTLPAAERVDAVEVPAGEVAPLAADGLARARLGVAVGDAASGVEVGRDLLGWGHFEDALVGGSGDGSTHWAVGSRKEAVVGEAAVGQGFLRLTRFSTHTESVQIRPVARVALNEHRLWREGPQGPEPADATPSYSVRFMARRTGDGSASLRFDLYAFDDTNPTEEPSSALLGQLERSFTLDEAGVWTPVRIDIEPGDLVFDGERANMTTMYVRLAPPQRGTAFIDIDDMSFIEWRPADAQADEWGAFSFVRNRGDSAARLQVPYLPFSTR
ncbi:MAG: CapA family protein [Deltaproteobacteria bacterium]|nr:CapA family protein [Deltaproteobacteria bacterium]